MMPAGAAGVLSHATPHQLTCPFGTRYGFLNPLRSYVVMQAVPTLARLSRLVCARGLREAMGRLAQQRIQSLERFEEK